jgi:choline dehydrogenase-like flavoprotein
MTTAGDEIFDYVIVGAGSAGCVLAERLSADGNNKVLVLEYGGLDNNWLMNLPFGVAKIWKDPRFKWPYESEPEPRLNGRRLSHPRGKVVGGSGSLNLMVYVRGHRADFDRWARAGLAGWSYAHVLPYFKRIERFADGPDPYRGAEGPIPVQTVPIEDPLIDVWRKAGESLRIPWATDYNGAEQEGLAVIQANYARGRRMSSGATFMRAARKRRNLRLVTRALVDRVRVQDGRAIGVEYEHGGKKRFASAAREVILCAGTYNTPQILMRSGIGPAAHLRGLGIEVVADRAGVGQNLQDHPGVELEFENTGPSRFEALLRYDRLVLNVLRGWLFRTGPAALPPVFCTSFVRSTAEAEIPDLQIYFGRNSYSSHPWFPLIRRAFPRRLSFMVCLLRPEARGSVSLRSADPTADPVIRNNFLDSAADLNALKRGLGLVRRLVSQPSYAPVCGAEVVPGAKVQDDNLDKYITDTVRTVYHPCGTCRMGVDAASVVDENLLVREVGNLRIVDASAMPDLTGGNINAPVMMIADRASDIILGRPTLPPATPDRR